jgi:predicted DNA-binding protein
MSGGDQARAAREAAKRMPSVQIRMEAELRATLILLATQADKTLSGFLKEIIMLGLTAYCKRTPP